MPLPACLNTTSPEPNVEYIHTVFGVIWEGVPVTELAPASEQASVTPIAKPIIFLTMSVSPSTAHLGTGDPSVVNKGGFRRAHPGLAIHGGLLVRPRIYGFV